MCFKWVSIRNSLFNSDCWGEFEWICTNWRMFFVCKNENVMNHSVVSYFANGYNLIDKVCSILMAYTIYKHIFRHIHKSYGSYEADTDAAGCLSDLTKTEWRLRDRIFIVSMWFCKIKTCFQFVSVKVHRIEI